MKTSSREWWNMNWLDRAGKYDIKSYNQMNDGAKPGDFLGQDELILGHTETKYGTIRMTLWNRRSWYWVITRQIMEQDKVTFGTGEGNIESWRDEIWDRMR